MLHPCSVTHTHSRSHMSASQAPAKPATQHCSLCVVLTALPPFALPAACAHPPIISTPRAQPVVCTQPRSYNKTSAVQLTTAAQVPCAGSVLTPSSSCSPTQPGRAHSLRPTTPSALHPALALQILPTLLWLSVNPVSTAELHEIKPSSSSSSRLCVPLAAHANPVSTAELHDCVPSYLPM
jgi:hypothetical protein